jgi:hypothetical protein
VFDIAANGFTTFASTVGTAKYAGAGVVVGNRVFFTPHNRDDVGIFNHKENTFTTLATTPLSGPSKFTGTGALIGGTVYFAPLDSDSMGVLDTSTDSFSTVANVGAAATGGSKFSGAVVIQSKVVLIPQSNNVGVFETGSTRAPTTAPTPKHPTPTMLPTPAPTLDPCEASDTGQAKCQAKEVTTPFSPVLHQINPNLPPVYPTVIPWFTYFDIR